MYVAVKGGEAAIANAHRLLADRRRGDRALPAIQPVTRGGVEGVDVAGDIFGVGLVLAGGATGERKRESGDEGQGRDAEGEALHEGLPSRFIGARQACSSVAGLAFIADRNDELAVLAEHTSPRSS